MALAPIALFVYNRPVHTLQTLVSLKNNDLAKESVLFIYADGPKPGSDEVLKKNIDALTDDGKPGTCRVKFIVDTTGNVSDVEALNMKGSVLARIVVDAIANGPKWVPAQQNGRVVRAYKEQPVTFTIENSR